MKKILNDLKHVNAGTWARTVLLALGVVNYFLNAFGIQVIAFDDSQITELVNAAYIAITGFYALWKNNSFTAEAQEAQHYLNDLKVVHKAIAKSTDEAQATNHAESNDDNIVMG
ncbi:phage holin [Streptococcus chenjunshii]|uniref:Phage holin n=1 Tax=Streptococcus chenjunshii TaxID=2173853 RepID=A0A372KMT3_9STRE|nr:phage holin [Streptococcus chenjunshii]AXQ79417.1 phage holin [Streptococcus chenjunshii]RFU51126.1 phage holin [Streptococcus chenjunshii]RFU53224.1 phage holin [Streptococcus chenjunshii]